MTNADKLREIKHDLGVIITMALSRGHDAQALAGIEARMRVQLLWDAMVLGGVLLADFK